MGWNLNPRNDTSWRASRNYDNYAVADSFRELSVHHHSLKFGTRRSFITGK